MIPVTTFRGKAVAVFGLGASGIAAARALNAGGAEVAAWDDSPGAREAAALQGLRLEDLKAANWNRFAALLLAPGVPLTHPEPHWTVRLAQAAGIPVLGDIELFCRERRRQAFKVPLVAITGTNGKSTATALTAHLLRSAGIEVELGGNIGTPALALAPFMPGRCYVLECSSFQLDLAESADPTVGILLNLSPDHIDRHGTFANYAAIKIGMLRRAEHPAIGGDDTWCRQVARDLSHPALQVFSAAHPVMGAAGGWWAEGTVLYRQRPGAAPETVADLGGLSPLRGAHNAQNALAAVLACDLLGVGVPALEAGLATFPGLAHRLEEVGRRGRTLFINDSKATNAASAEKALLAWDGGIYWIAGGRPKEGGIAPLEPLFSRIAKAYLIGEAAPAFAATLAGHVDAVCAGTLEAAVSLAAQEAERSGAREPVVLFSPACASYDQFRNFEERGEAFCRLAAALPGFQTSRARRAAACTAGPLRP